MDSVVQGDEVPIDRSLSSSVEPVSIKGRQIASVEVESILRNKKMVSVDTVDGGESDDILLKIQPAILRILHQHQIDGISFINDKLTNGGGCILAHGMGMGKTLQTLVFCDIFPTWRTVCVIPIILLSVWEAEVHKFTWKFNTFTIQNAALRLMTGVINEWTQKKGILFVGYELYVSILKGKMKDSLMEPDLLIFDEGHRIKNYDNKMFNILNKINCKRRLIITGYPLQNNLMEYWAMMNFIKPNLLGSQQYFKTFFVGPIEEGQCVDSSAANVQTMKQRVFILQKMLSEFVHRKCENLELPSLKHNVILVQMTDLQKDLIEQCHKMYGKNALVLYAMTLRIMAHPDLMQDENVLSQSECEDVNLNENDELLKCEVVFPADYVKDLLESSPKLELCLLILDECMKHGDKVVIFSQSVNTLNLLEKFLQRSKNHQWIKLWNYFRIDGETSMKDRTKMLNEFNTNENIHLFLMSTRTCALGLNLTIANIIIIFDNCWNPCLDMQAVCRVHRYGQTKLCFVYRLVMDSCLEKNVYYRQLNKQLLFARVVDNSSPSPLLSMHESQSVFNSTKNKFQDSDYYNKCKDSVMQVVCDSKSSHMSAPPFEHQLHLLDSDVELTNEERVVAMKSFEIAVRKLDDADSSNTENVANGDSLESMKVESGGKIKRRRIQTENEVVRRKTGNVVVPVPVEGQVESRSIRRKDTADKDQGSIGGTNTSQYIPLEVWKKQGMHVQNITLTEHVVFKKNDTTIRIEQGETIMRIIGPNNRKYIQRCNGELISLN